MASPQPTDANTLLSLIPYPEISPSPVSFPPLLPIFCLLLPADCSESEIRRFGIFCQENTDEVVGKTIVISEQCPWEALPWASDISELYWTQSNPLFTPYLTSSAATLLVMRGLIVLQRLSPPPSNYLSCLSQPLEIAELAEKIAQGDTERLMQAYFLTRQTHTEMDIEGISDLCMRIGLEYGLDLEKAIEWYKSPICESDRSDVIDIKDVSFREFTKRLHNYCKNSLSPKHHCSKHDLPSKHVRVLVLKTRLQACEAQIHDLITTLSERDNTISQLLTRLEANEREIEAASEGKRRDFRSRLSSTDQKIEATDLKALHRDLQQGNSADLVLTSSQIATNKQQMWKLQVMPPPREPVGRKKEVQWPVQKKRAPGSVETEPATRPKAVDLDVQRPRAVSKTTKADAKTLKIAGKLTLSSKIT